MVDPGDSAIFKVASSTGLKSVVIDSHPKGLMQEISEGGAGLSGGQRQLVNLTRLILRRPSIWLLDEPTASMDRQLEMVITRKLKELLGTQDTLIMVTHKPEMLELVDRLLVVIDRQVVMDGPKAQVLARLQQGQRRGSEGRVVSSAMAPA